MMLITRAPISALLILILSGTIVVSKPKCEVFQAIEGNYRIKANQDRWSILPFDLKKEDIFLWFSRAPYSRDNTGILSHISTENRITESEIKQRSLSSEFIIMLNFDGHDQINVQSSIKTQTVRGKIRYYFEWLNKNDAVNHNQIFELAKKSNTVSLSFKDATSGKTFRASEQSLRGIISASKRADAEHSRIDRKEAAQGCSRF